MRVLLVTNDFDANGATIMLYHLASHLVAVRGWEVGVFTTEERSGDLRARFAALGVSFHARALFQDFDLAIINTLFGARDVAVFAPHLKTIFWVHEGATSVGNILNDATFDFGVFTLPDRIVFSSPVQQNQIFASFLNKVPPERIRIVPPGAPPRPPARPAPEAPADDGKQRILCVGSIYRRKGPHDLIEAVAALDDDKVECMLVGSFAMLDTLGPGAAERLKWGGDRFRLPGVLLGEALDQCYAAADVFCLASYDETFGMAAVEAGHYGLPLVLTDLPAYRGIWNHGRNCLMVPPGDVALLRWMLRILLDDPALRARLGEAARHTAKRFSIANSMRQFDGVIDELLDI